MSAGPTPNFFMVLDLLIQAFHLDHADPDLLGGGPFQHQLSGRRFDIKDEGMQRLLRRFAAALLRSDILPVLSTSLQWDRAGARDQAVVHYLGSANSLPPCLDDAVTAITSRLAWLAQQHESLLSKARSQDLGDDTDPAFALMPVMRFAWHHLTFSMAGLLWCGFLQDSDLDGMASHWAWGMETPTSTPMKDACVATGMTRGRLLLDIVRSDSGLVRAWDEKTLDNLWNGGPSHPTFDSIATVVEQLCPKDSTALSRWRRWYGFRHIARQFAALWGWEWLGGCLGTSVVHARMFAHDLQRSSLNQDQRRVVASVGLWSGWRTTIARFASASLSRLPGDEPHPTLRLDYRAIGDGTEDLRIDDCVSMLRGLERFPQELERRGESGDAARRTALHLAWMFQGDLTKFSGLHPVLALIVARHRQDWQAAEQAAKNLVNLKADLVDNHFVLVEALAQQGKFADALEVVRVAKQRFPSDPSVARAEVLTLMLRGEHQRSHEDFERARDLLHAMAPAKSDWDLHLLLADCHLALGDWVASRQECRLVAEYNDQCGEARAIASICSGKLGERQPDNKAAEHAVHRGESALLEELRRRDTAGELGSFTIVPIPRWHRLYVQRLSEVPHWFPQG